MNFKRTVAFFMSVLMLVSFAGCEDSANNKTTAKNNSSKDDIAVNQTPSVNTLTEIKIDYLDTSAMFSDRETSNVYKLNDAKLITLDNNTAQTNADGVSLDEDVLTITKEGIYVLNGIYNGQIVVDAPDNDKVQIVLKNAEITSDKAAAIYCKSGDKLFITTHEDTENSISANGSAYEDNGTNIDGAIFSKSDLCVNGKGSLSINSATNGMVSKDDVTIGGGKITIVADNHAIEGKDSVRIADGDVVATSGKDGIHSENADDTTKGFVYIANGNFTLNTTCDGISSSMIVQIENGDFNITTTGDNNTSSKGIKSETSLIIQNGNYIVSSTDDGLHSALNTVIDNGDITLTCKDDGIHSDNNISINDGKVKISESYEGFEAQTINITGGTVEIHANDDGFNAAGGNDQNDMSGDFGGERGPDKFFGGESLTGYVNISGGNINVYADGDGIDANGTIYISGGETVIVGPQNGGNGSLDYGLGAEITGGTFVAVGSSQMAENFTSATQGAILVTVPNGNEKIEIKNKSGKVMYSLDPDINYSAVVFSSPEIKEGETYTVSSNGDNVTVEMTSTIYGSGNGFFGMGGGDFGGGGEPGKRPDGNMGNVPTNPPDDFENFNPEEFKGQLPEGFENFNPEDFKGQLPEDFENFNPEDFKGQFPEGMELPQDMQPPVI